MEHRYVALLRGINVGGNNKINMSELKLKLSDAGLSDVGTYINSGNIVFSSHENNAMTLAKDIEKVIEKAFGLSVRCTVIQHAQLGRIVKQMYEIWQDKEGWRYNVIFLIPPYDIDTIVKSIGVLKPDIEAVVVGEGVLFLAQYMPAYGRTRTSRIPGNPVYQNMTMRSPGTTKKLLELLG